MRLQRQVFGKKGEYNSFTGRRSTVLEQRVESHKHGGSYNRLDMRVKGSAFVKEGASGVTHGRSLHVKGPGAGTIRARTLGRQNLGKQGTRLGGVLAQLTVRGSGAFRVQSEVVERPGGEVVTRTRLRSTAGQGRLNVRQTFGSELLRPKEAKELQAAYDTDAQGTSWTTDSGHEMTRNDAGELTITVEEAGVKPRAFQNKYERVELDAEIVETDE